MMKGYRKIVWVHLKLLMREPPAFFFTLIFPALLLVFFGSVFGNDVDPESYRKFGYVDYQVAALSGLIIATTGILGIPVATAFRREYGVLRRYRATPLHPATYLAADISTQFIITLLGMMILVLLGKAIFHLRFAGSWPSVLAGFTLSALSFFAAGYVLASLAPTGRMAQAMGQAIFFPMMFLSGAAIPVQIMPASMRRISELLPLTHVIQLLQGLWFGEPWRTHLTQVAVLVTMLVVGVVLSAKTFRWE
jgi:ABC-2 type transport system permease protein